jgi:hypothetical protein
MFELKKSTLQPNWLFSESDIAWMRLHESNKQLDTFLLAKKINVKLIHQLKCRQKLVNKLPTFTGHEQIFFPPSLHLEQASSEVAASFKSTIVKGKRMMDMTAGFGIDGFYFAKKFESNEYQFCFGCGCA